MVTTMQEAEATKKPVQRWVCFNDVYTEFHISRHLLFKLIDENKLRVRRGIDGRKKFVNATTIENVLSELVCP
jgi:hypothetical protein